MTAAEAKLLQRWQILVAIEDARLGQIRLVIGARVEYQDCGHIPHDVVASVVYIERRLGNRGERS